VLKGVLTPDDWVLIQNRIRYDFMKDNFFEELKETEILREKINTLNEVEPLVGKYFSREWVIKNVLFMSEDEQREMQKQIDAEREMGYYGDVGIPDGEELPPGEAPPEEVMQGQSQQLSQSISGPSPEEGLSIINTSKFRPQQRASR
jgi:hypothetical protein